MWPRRGSLPVHQGVLIDPKNVLHCTLALQALLRVMVEFENEDMWSEARKEPSREAQWILSIHDSVCIWITRARLLLDNIKDHGTCVKEEYQHLYVHQRTLLAMRCIVMNAHFDCDKARSGEMSVYRVGGVTALCIRWTMDRRSFPAQLAVDYGTDFPPNPTDTCLIWPLIGHNWIILVNWTYGPVNTKRKDKSNKIPLILNPPTPPTLNRQP